MHGRDREPRDAEPGLRARVVSGCPRSGPADHPRAGASPFRWGAARAAAGRESRGERGMLAAVSRLAIGLVYDLLGTYPRRPGDPPDADAEYEPEATIARARGGDRAARTPAGPARAPARAARGDRQGRAAGARRRALDRGGLRRAATARPGRPCCSRWPASRRSARTRSRSRSRSTRRWPARSSRRPACRSPPGCVVGARRRGGTRSDSGRLARSS